MNVEDPKERTRNNEVSVNSYSLPHIGSYDRDKYYDSVNLGSNRSTASAPPFAGRRSRRQYNSSYNNSNNIHYYSKSSYNSLYNESAVRTTSQPTVIPKIVPKARKKQRKQKKKKSEIQNCSSSNRWRSL